MLIKITLILFIIFIGCDSYEERFFEQDYEEDPIDIAYSEIKYHRINGSKQRVKKLEFDNKDVLRKEIFFGHKFINKIRFYNEDGVIAKQEIFNVDSNDKLTGQRIIYYPNANKKEEYDFSNQKQISRALAGIVEQLNSTFLQQQKEDQERFTWYLS